VLGAIGAGLWVALAKVNRALLGGLLLGPSILAIAYVQDLTLAVILMVAIGICGGFFIVPLNALLQERGHETIGAGNALAVQNFAENIAMLVFVGGYGWAATVAISIRTSIIGFGLALLMATAALTVSRLKKR
jgi:LPLT family lysophospholipid transporter-like MFS transporter